MIISSRRLAAAAALGLAIPLLLGPVAHAAPSTKVPVATPQAALKGYQRVTTGPLSDTAQAQTQGQASCPAGTRLVGGGAEILGNSLDENINSSFPDGLTWIAYVDNANTSAGSFYVFANCVKKVSKYSIVTSAPVDNPAGLQNRASVTCPKGTVALGGGSENSSTSTAVVTNDSFPYNPATTWGTDVNNNGGSDDTIYAVAICGKKPAGFTLVAGPANSIAASSQGDSTVTCPSGTEVLSGGNLSSSSSVTVDLNSTYPYSNTSWAVYENDTATVGSTVTSYALCVKA